MNSPFVYRDTCELKRIPETIGYLDPMGDDRSQRIPTLPADLVKRAKALKVVRNGWAGIYFGSYFDLAYLAETVNGIKKLGFQFVPIDGNTR